jgi:hypothetical protein
MKTEPYSGSPSGTRMVQYFDKARMEINNPQGDRASDWFVTTGLLVAEMVSGKQQTGDRQYKPHRAAEIAVGGDGLTKDPDAPTYTSFRPVASLAGPGANRAPNRVGQAVSATIERAGNVGDEPALGKYPGATLAAYDETLGHNIPAAMWDFLNLRGPVRERGETLGDTPIANWVFVMGYPITEAYWARVMIDGVYNDVLFQMFERRTLAYIPSFEPGWQVQMGNVGAHYYRWLYGGPLPESRVKLVQAPPGSEGLPANVNATVEPQTGAPGTNLLVSISGFGAGEEIVSWFTGPDGRAFDTRIELAAGPDGGVKDIPVPTGSLGPGQWAVTFHGKATRNEAIAYFLLNAPATPTKGPAPPAATAPAGTPPAGTPTRPPTRTPQPPQGTPTPSETVPVVPTEPAGGMLVSVRPAFGPPDGTFTFEVRGLQAGEQVQVAFTDPTRAVVYPAGSNDGRYQAGADGKLLFSLVPVSAFPAAPPGNWLFEVRGVESGLEGVTGFVLR